MPDRTTEFGNNLKTWGPAICLASGMTCIGCALSWLDGAFKVFGFLVMAVGILAMGYFMWKGISTPARK
jgi:membrane protein YqaA with SNARE-associated domain